ncbi:MAG: hypothetical protein H6509_07715 [Bryobacterales bacterium]|nr:hypothetical protein [Bryobacterales bacterium]
MKTFVSILTLSCLAVATLAADSLRLKSGETLEGTFLGGDSRSVKFLSADGSVKNYPVADVAALGFGDSDVAVSAPSAPVVSAPKPVKVRSSGKTVPSGTVVTVRMIDSIDSDANGVGERFRASLEEPLVVDGREVAPRGADAIVTIAKVDQAGKISGKEEVAVELAGLTINGQEYAVNSNYAEVEGKSKTKQTAKTAGGGAALGAIIGAIAGGGKGAAIGAGVGAGAGTVYSATRGSTVRIPSETLLTFSLREDLAL